MADKRIQDLTPASSVQTSDRFVLEQSGQAKSLTGQVLIDDLATALDGHGGISDISYTAPSVGSLTGTLTITLADETVETFSVTNGKGISSITKTAAVLPDLDDEYTITYNDGTTYTFTLTNGKSIESIADKWAVSDSNSSSPSTWYDAPQTMTATDRYEWHYQTITFNDGTTLDTDEAVVGVYGDTGDADHVYIKWAATEPTSDSDMSSTPDAWIGVATTTADSAPSHYTDYSWYEYKGDKGDTGNGIVSITLESSSGVIDTYKVLFDDGTYTTFSVTNGSNINSITKTSTSGLIDTYTVSLTNGDTTSFNVVNAKSITSITNVDVTHVAGHTDVYRINYNDGDTFTFSIYNGTNGSGSVSTVDGVASDGVQNVTLLLLGSGAPTTSTVGILKQRYFDQTNSVLYICTGIDSSGGESTYTWQGAGVTVDNALSLSSTNPVQNAVLTSIIGLDTLDTTAQTLTGAVNELKADMSGFAENIAEEYDPTATYAVNDLCIHDNTLYRCNTAITTVEAWNSIHWTQTTIADNKVSKTGDTMSGVLIRKFGNDFPTSTPSATSTPKIIYATDVNENRIGGLEAYYASNGERGVTLTAERKIDANTTVWNYVHLSINDEGTKTVFVNDPSAWRTAIGAVNKAGDTMTGSLTMSNVNIAIKDTANNNYDTPQTSSAKYVLFRDKVDNNTGYVGAIISSAGYSGVTLVGARKVNGSTIENTLSLLVNSAGTRIVSISDASVWRTALGLGTSGALPITLSQGGTGQTSNIVTSTLSNIITAASGFQITSGTYQRWGKLAAIHFVAKRTGTSITSSTSMTVATLVSDKRPAVMTTVDFVTTVIPMGYCETNGVITAYGTWNNNAAYNVLMVYILP